MLGDRPQDLEAGGKAGVKTITLRCGGWADTELGDAVESYDDPQALLQGQRMGRAGYSP